MYPRTLLNKIKIGENWGTPLHQSITQDLLNKLTTSSDELSMAEARYICNCLPVLRSSETDEANLDPYDFPKCKEAFFSVRYLIYHNDINGYRRNTDWNGKIPLDIQQRDIEFLEQQYQEWVLIIERENHSDAILKNLASETRHQLKKIEAYSNQVGYGQHRREYLRKSITLHGKYIYLLTKEYYEELGALEQIISINGKKIVIDSFAYIHSFFGHFAAHIKVYQQDKSYFSDEKIDFKNFPQIIFEIITTYFDSFGDTSFNGRSIYFRLRGTISAIWFRPMKRSLRGGMVENFLRLQTFYPVTSARDLGVVRSLSERLINSELSFFI
jgi:hypothetical protein